jgi:SAM-dependent methyltransferase
MAVGLDVMGIEALLREHRYSPIVGDVLTIGRQSIRYTPEQLLATMQDFGVLAGAVDLANIELEARTRRARAIGDRMISDRAFFGLLGAKAVRAIDFSDEESAEIIHDLTQPLPDELHEIADFVVDGSSLDNMFNPAQALRNYASLLRPGGRVLTVNAFSCWNTPYAIMPPLWYLDYFVMNKFDDCKAYVVIVDEEWRMNVYWLDVHFLQRRRRDMGRFIAFDETGRRFNPPQRMMTVILAEKGRDSTVDRYPIQQEYRSDEDWEVFASNLALIEKSPRPHLLRSNCEAFFADTPGGHLRVGGDYQAIP